MTITYYDKVYTCTTGAIINLDDATNVGDVWLLRVQGAIFFVLLILFMGFIAHVVND